MINWAHFHLLLNHVPVLGTVFGLSLLGWAMLRRDLGVQRVALGVFVAIAMLAFPAYFSGEPAKDVVEQAASISDLAIEAHEHAALVSLIGVELLGLVALGGLYAARRHRPLSANVTRAALFVSLVTAGLMARTANLGGQIRHLEIQAGAESPRAPNGDENEGG
jgi:uncharacterized membrane protein